MFGSRAEKTCEWKTCVSSSMCSCIVLFVHTPPPTAATWWPNFYSINSIWLSFSCCCWHRCEEQHPDDLVEWVHKELSTTKTSAMMMTTRKKTHHIRIMFDPLSLLLNDSWKKIRNVYKTLSEQFQLVLCGTNGTEKTEDRDGHMLFSVIHERARQAKTFAFFVSILRHDLQNHIKSLKIMETYASSCYGRWTLMGTHTNKSLPHEYHQKSTDFYLLVRHFAHSLPLTV